MRIRNLTLAFVVALLSGCTSMPSNPTLPNEDAMTENLIRDWNDKAPNAISYVPTQSSIIATAPQSLPADIASRPFMVSFAEDMTLGDLHPFLQAEGLSLVIPDPDLRATPMVLFEFNGELGNFLSALGIAYGISFNWHPGNILTAEATSQYMIKVPQDADLSTEVQAAILGLGAEGISASQAAGSISYRASYEAHQRIISYIQEVSLNAAVITMQAAIVTVSMDRNRDQGFDWSQLQAKVGNLGIDNGELDLGGESGGNNNGGGEGDDVDGGTGVPPIVQPTGLNLKDTQSLLAVSQQGAGLILSKGDLNLRAVVQLLSTYGETETTQSVLMKTLSGKQVKLDSSQQIPFVAEIGSSVSANVGGLNNQSSVKIEDLDVGLNFKLTPFFDAHTGLVTVDVDVTISSLISFVEISAGNDVGNITRPNTQKQEFTDMLRMLPGESVIIGGLMYDQISDKRSALSPIDRLPLASQSQSTTRNALFILLRPTITVFGDPAAVGE